MRALALSMWLVCTTAAAQSPARPALFALDDRAIEAWRYAFRTLNYGYPGASRAESMRALGHAAGLLDASARAVAALRAAGATAQADELEATRQGLAEAMCPGVSDARTR